MTTVAWDGESLAADRLICAGGGSVRDGTVIKIARRGDGALCGVSGEVARAIAFLRWFLAGEREPYPAHLWDREKNFDIDALIVRPDGSLVNCPSEAGPVALAEPQTYAIGSGFQFALGAMACGATAEQAVRVAAMFDVKTGSEIDVLRLAPAPVVSLAAKAPPPGEGA